MLRSFIEIGPKMGQGEVTKELKGVLELWGVLAGTGTADARILLEPRTMENQSPKLLLPVPKDQFQVEIDDVLGEVTVVAHVEARIDAGETHQTIRLLRGGPAGELERGAIEEALPSIVEGLSEIGIAISKDDIIIDGPGLLLRPICAFR
jgi:hypothetical protein